MTVCPVYQGTYRKQARPFLGQSLRMLRGLDVVEARSKCAVTFSSKSVQRSIVFVCCVSLHRCHVSQSTRLEKQTKTSKDRNNPAAWYKDLNLQWTVSSWRRMLAISSTRNKCSTLYDWHNFTILLLIFFGDTLDIRQSSGNKRRRDDSTVIEEKLHYWKRMRHKGKNKRTKIWRFAHGASSEEAPWAKRHILEMIQLAHLTL